MRRSWIESGACVLAVEGQRALAHRLKSGDEAQERGLARARGSEQRQKLARRDGEIDGIERPMGAEVLRDAADLDAPRVGATRQRRRGFSRAAR